MPRHATGPKASSRTEHAPIVQDRDPSPVADKDTETKFDNLTKRFGEETSELRRLIERLIEARGSVERETPRGTRATGQRKPEKTQVAEPGGRSDAREPGDRREGGKRDGAAGWASLCVAGRTSELITGASR